MIAVSDAANADLPTTAILPVSDVRIKASAPFGRLLPDIVTVISAVVFAGAFKDRQIESRRLEGPRSVMASAKVAPVAPNVIPVTVSTP